MTLWQPWSHPALHQARLYDPPAQDSSSQLTSCHSRTPLQARSLLETDCCPPRAEAPSWAGEGPLTPPGATVPVC